MNDKQNLMNEAIDIVLGAVSYERKDGTMSVTREDLLSSERKGDNVGMSRAILVCMLLLLGFNKESIADLLNRSVQTISEIFMRSNVYWALSLAYRKAYLEAERKCREIIEKNAC